MKRDGIMLILLLSSLLVYATGCGKKSEVYNSSSQEGYKTISSVDGVTFEVPSSVTSTATAITQITPETDFEYDVTYSYKDGCSNYLLFNLRGVVIGVSNTTHYDITSFNSDEIKNAFLNESLLGIWFEGDNEKITVESDRDKMIATVDAQVVITTEFYGDYCGKFGYIKYDTGECAIFAGVPVSSWEDVPEKDRETISYIVKSLRLNSNQSQLKQENDTGQAITPAVTPTVTPVVTEPVKISPDPTPTQRAEPTPEPTHDEEPTPQTVLTATPAAEEPTVPAKPTEAVLDDTAHPPEITEAPDTEQGVPEHQGLNIMNQSNNEKSDGPVESTIYSMCSIGQTSYVDAYCQESQSITTGCVILEEVLMGSEAEEFLKRYCRRNQFEYIPPDNGTTWHVAALHYDFGTSTDPYVNVRLVGMDGDNLIYRGVPYSKVTHDVLHEPGSDITYVFYAVPNGCKEYALEIGMGICDSNDTINSAYYKVNM